MQIDVVAPFDLSPEDIAAWTRLQDQNPNLSSPYLSPQWVLACAGVNGPDRKGAVVAIIRRDGEAVGFLPVRRTGSTALPVGAPLCDYQGLVAAPGLTICPKELVKGLSLHRLDFTHMLADQRPFAPFLKGRWDSQVVDISPGYDAYATERREGGHGILKDAAKKGRKFEREQGKLQFTPLSTDRAAFEQLITLKRAQYKRTKQTDIFEAGWPLDLLRNLFATRDAAFGGAFFTLGVEGRPVAMHFALRHNDVLHCWFIAHETEFERYSPGVLLIDHMLRWGSSVGIREFDFGAGDYRFKLQLANRTRQVGYGFVGAPSVETLVRSAQYRVRRAAEALPLGPVSALPGKAMRRMDLWRGLGVLGDRRAESR